MDAPAQVEWTRLVEHADVLPYCSTARTPLDRRCPDHQRAFRGHTTLHRTMNSMGCSAHAPLELAQRLTVVRSHLETTIAREVGDRHTVGPLSIGGCHGPVLTTRSACRELGVVGSARTRLTRNARHPTSRMRSQRVTR